MTRPTLVLLPGMDGTGRLFAALVRALGEAFPVVVIAYPVDRALAYPRLHEIVESSIPTAGDYMLVAESFSGPIALEHAASQPARLRGMVLAASFAASPLPRALAWLRVLVGVVGWRPARFVVRLLLTGWDAPAELIEEVCGVIATVRPEVLVDRLRQIFAVDARPALSATAVPVLYLAGRRDRLVGMRGLRQCRRGGRHLSARVVDGPHLLLQRRPVEAAAAIAEFAGFVAG